MKRDAGFTLVELAIVLVIIGIILGAVLKGQDLIANARAKRFINKVRHWEAAIWTYYDRYGRFPGDQNRNGKIGDGNVKNDLVSAGFANPPYEGSSGSEKNTITLGSTTFYVFLGTDSGNDTGTNVIILCKAGDCGESFDNKTLVLVRSLDASFDGVANGTDGQVVCSSNVERADNGTWIGYLSSSTPASCDNSAKAVVYYFDTRR